MVQRCQPEQQQQQQKQKQAVVAGQPQSRPISARAEDEMILPLRLGMSKTRCPAPPSHAPFYCEKTSSVPPSTRHSAQPSAAV